MSEELLRERLRELQRLPLPLPGAGRTAERHEKLFAIAAEDVSLAKLAEAHWDAVAILAEAGRIADPGALYAVWASEIPGQPLRATSGRVNGVKHFASGIGIVDRALVTAGEDGRLIDLDLRHAGIKGDLSAWSTMAFKSTATGAVHFTDVPFQDSDVVGEPGFYLARPGFWHGACGPAACWAGGAAGLLPYARSSRRRDPHTVAHLGALEADIWALEAALRSAGDEIDRHPDDRVSAQRRALTLRHIVEQLASDILRRFARAFGPFPLAMNESTSRRFAEVELFLRQSHGERDLEALGHLVVEDVFTPS